ncbi:MAG: DUF2889 domain-containing protein [Chloroflexi bacterium]|nr:DUF2889 domain-containing protein [Chloroflexota bacterium]
MTLFSRNITVDIDEGENENLIVTSRMVDVFHDITVTLDVSHPGFTILDAHVEMAKVPSQNCYLIYPVAKKLIGLSIARGFNRSVVNLLAGVAGCSNILNLVLAAAPLAINAAHIREERGRRPRDRGQGTRVQHPTPVPRPLSPDPDDNYLKGTCIAHP